MYTSLRHSQPSSFAVSHSTSPDGTTLSAQHFLSSDLLCRRFDSLRDPAVSSNSFRQSAENEYVSLLLLSTHSACFVTLRYINMLLTLTFIYVIVWSWAYDYRFNAAIIRAFQPLIAYDQYSAYRETYIHNH